MVCNSSKVKHYNAYIIRVGVLPCVWWTHYWYSEIPFLYDKCINNFYNVYYLQTRDMSMVSLDFEPEVWSLKYRKWKIHQCGAMTTTSFLMSTTKDKSLLDQCKILTSKGCLLKLRMVLDFLEYTSRDALTWSLNTNCILNKAQQSRSFLRCLRSLDLWPKGPKGLVKMYHCTLRMFSQCDSVVWQPGSQDCYKGQ